MVFFRRKPFVASRAGNDKLVLAMVVPNMLPREAVRHQRAIAVTRYGLETYFKSAMVLKGALAQWTNSRML